MSATGSWVAQKAIFSAIRGNAEIMAMISNVYDAVPQDAAFPLIVVGEGTETDASSFGQAGHEVHPEIQVWSHDGETSNASSGSAGYKVPMAIAEKIVDLLLTSGLTVDGHDCEVLFLEEFERQRPSPEDPSLRLVAPKLKLLLEDSDS